MVTKRGWTSAVGEVMGRRRPLVRRGNSMKSLKNKLKLTLRFLLGGQVNGVTDREGTQEGFTLRPIISSPSL